MEDNDFMNVNDFIKEENIYQIQVDNKKINIKKIGKGKFAENMTICEKIGKRQDISVYSVVYLESELIDCEKTTGNYDLLKLYQFNDGNEIFSELIININSEYKISETNKIDEINDFDLFFVSQIKDKEEKFIKKFYEKNINKNNLFETLIFEHTNLYNKI